MPYHSHRRTDCNTGRPHPSARAERPSLAADEGSADRYDLRVEPRSGATVSHPARNASGVEYQVRAARVTDIERLVALSDDAIRPARADGPLVAADLMRQLVYLPQASIVVAESQRIVVGGAILALRPSVQAGGYVGTIDLLVVDPEHDADRITAALLEELLRSASNKGCTVVETVRPDDPAALARLQGMGFSEAGPRISRTVAAAGSAARRSI